MKPIMMTGIVMSCVFECRTRGRTNPSDQLSMVTSCNPENMDVVTVE